MNQDFMTSKEVAKKLRVTTSLLTKWRRERKGPPFIKVSDRIYQYPIDDFNTWYEKNRVETKQSIPQPITTEYEAEVREL